jgi:hypothetical protein
MKMRIVVVLMLALGITTKCLAQHAPGLVAEDVIAKLMDRTSQRERLGAGYTGTRQYVLENHQFDKRAEMVVNVKCDADGTKHFEVVSENGSKSANKRVLRKMLESEEETSQPQIRPRTSLTPENYSFQMLGSESLDSRPMYVVQVIPKREDKYLFEGRIWVDAEDFAVVRAEGKPAKSPSFWTRSVTFVQQYQKSGTFWFPLSMQSVTEARIFGTTEVRISYSDYHPNSTVLPSALEKTHMDLREARYAQK